MFRPGLSLVTLWRPPTQPLGIWHPEHIAQGMVTMAQLVAEQTIVTGGLHTDTRVISTGPVQCSIGPDADTTRPLSLIPS
jgi:hypothetical protein